MAYIQLRHPQWLHVATSLGKSFGYNQEWYHEEWQRIAGCGPTTAAQMVAYLQHKVSPETSDITVETALQWMEQLWPYLRPHYGGLYKVGWFKKGLEAYFKDSGLAYDVESLSIYPFHIGAPDLEIVASFIENGLSSDIPVAFLNRHRGSEEGLSTWHWVPIVGLRKDGKEYRGYVYDEEIERQFSLNKWLQETTLGGGFVYARPHKVADGRSKEDGVD